MAEFSSLPQPLLVEILSNPQLLGKAEPAAEHISGGGLVGHDRGQRRHARSQGAWVAWVAQQLRFIVEQDVQHFDPVRVAQARRAELVAETRLKSPLHACVSRRMRQATPLRNSSSVNCP